MKTLIAGSRSITNKYTVTGYIEEAIDEGNLTVTEISSKQYKTAVKAGKNRKQR